MVLFLFLRGIYSYPLRRTAIIIGSLSLPLCFFFTTYPIYRRFEDIRQKESDEQNGYIHFDTYLPFVYNSTSGLVLSAILGYSVCIASALVIFGAIKEKRFLLLPFVILQCIAIIHVSYWFIDSLTSEYLRRWYLMYLAMLVMQVQLTFSIFRHFQELSEIDSSFKMGSNLPYDNMANAI